jgi:hypothetical protein
MTARALVLTLLRHYGPHPDAAIVAYARPMGISPAAVRSARLRLQRSGDVRFAGAGIKDGRLRKTGANHHWRMVIKEFATGICGMKITPIFTEAEREKLMRIRVKVTSGVMPRRFR